MKRAYVVFAIAVGVALGLWAYPVVGANAAGEGSDLKQILENQTKILTHLEEIKKELYIVKIRASR